MTTIKHRKIYFIFSGLIVLGSIVALILWQFNFGIDFTGGSLLEAEYKDVRPDIENIKESLVPLDLGEINIQPTGEKGIILRLKDVDEDTHQSILTELRALGELEEKRFESIGPVIGQELKKKAVYSILLALLAILIYIAWAFRKVSYPIKSYRYGLIALCALFHDVVIILGVFSILGRFYNIEIGTPFIAALLATLGYSVNDTIVVFDRIRENLLSSITGREDFEAIVGKSVRQTIVRSLNTSLTTLFVLFAIFFFGGESIQYFVLALIFGIIVGTYSSIFIASPLLVAWEKRKKT